MDAQTRSSSRRAQGPSCGRRALGWRCAAIALILSACATRSGTEPIAFTTTGMYTNLKGQELFTLQGAGNEVPAGNHWLPLYAKSDDQGDSDFTIISRNDGTLQWTYRGEPVYYFNGDDSARRADPDLRSGRFKQMNYSYSIGTPTTGGSGH